mmetsp:Transcript_22306/g.65867  ORF Transcript_22306/g.65867 Transcript_22306/m.65867 type:complete len:202 (-) Transcript_22306:690-1295(-)
MPGSLWLICRIGKQQLGRRTVQQVHDRLEQYLPVCGPTQQNELVHRLSAAATDPTESGVRVDPPTRLVEEVGIRQRRSTPRVPPRTTHECDTQCGAVLHDNGVRRPRNETSNARPRIDRLEPLLRSIVECHLLRIAQSHASSLVDAILGQHAHLAVETALGFSPRARASRLSLMCAAVCRERASLCARSTPRSSADRFGLL